MKYYIIAGEPSGDLHASNLMKELKKKDANAEFRFWGGDLMQQVGGNMVKHYNDTAFMGVWEVLINYKKIKQNFKHCEADLIDNKPDVLILVDYAGFNLRVAKFAHNMGLRVFYYISPKLWAWNTKRVKKVKKYVERMFVIMPFESDFYKKYDVKVDYIGNPVWDAISTRSNKNETTRDFIERNQLSNKPIISILAGSRKQEVARILPDMLLMIEKFPDYQFIIAGAPSFTIDNYNTYIEGYDVKVLFGETYSLLQHSQAAMVTSGTATLEAGLLNCPQVVCYKMWGGGFTDFVAKKVLMKVDYISLVNLILDRECVIELFQKTFSLEALQKQLELLTGDANERKRMFDDYEELRNKTGNPGCSEQAAGLMIKYLEEGAT